MFQVGRESLYAMKRNALVALFATGRAAGTRAALEAARLGEATRTGAGFEGATGLGTTCTRRLARSEGGFRLPLSGFRGSGTRTASGAGSERARRRTGTFTFIATEGTLGGKTGLGSKATFPARPTGSRTVEVRARRAGTVGVRARHGRSRASRTAGAVIVRHRFDEDLDGLAGLQIVVIVVRTLRDGVAATLVAVIRTGLAPALALRLVAKAAASGLAGESTGLVTERTRRRGTVTRGAIECRSVAERTRGRRTVSSGAIIRRLVAIGARS